MILVFSGTGNSRYIADALADRLQDEVVSLNEVIKQNKEKAFTSEKPFVIVAPIYAWRYPNIVEDVIETADFSGSKDIYFIATMGENTGNCDKFVAKLAKNRGMNCKGFRGIVMPNNYVVDYAMESEAVNDVIVAAALPQVDEVAVAIKAGDVIHKTDKTKMAGVLSGPVHNMFSKHMHSSENYVVSDACVSCGKCVSLCVMNNVTMEEGKKPSFGTNCINCYACLQYCPKQAINIAGKTESHGRYTCKAYVAE